MKQNSELKGAELEELISNVRQNSQVRSFIFIIFLLIELVLKRIGVNIPGMMIELMGLLLVTNLLYGFLTKRIWPQQTVRQVNLGYFIIQIIEIAIILIGIHFLEVVLSWGVVILMFYILLSYLAFTKRIYPRIITILSIIGYFFIALAKYLGVVTFIDYHDLGINPYQNYSFFVSTTAFIGGLFICFSLYGDIFSARLREMINELRNNFFSLLRKEKELMDTKNSLKSELKEKTDKSGKLSEELKALNTDFEEKVAQRTKELQSRIEELERFQKAAVDREVKMVELKEKIKKLEESSKIKTK